MHAALLPRYLRSSTAALALLASGTQARADVSITLDKNLYQGGESVTLTINGAPGNVPFLLIDGAPGNWEFPGIGTVLLALSPSLVVIQLPPLPPTASTSVTCNVQCGDPSQQSPCFFQVAAVDFGAFRTTLSNLAVLESVNGSSCGDCAADAVSDGACNASGHSHALWLPGIATDLVWVESGHFVEHADGTARLSGVVQRAADHAKRFAVDMLFTGRAGFGEPAFPPVGSPKQELAPACYLAGGGSVNTDLWHYYQGTIGSLTGLDAWAGASLAVVRAGPAFQVGVGANGKNTEHGASGWLDVSTLAQPGNGDSFPSQLPGDVNIDLDGDCTDCAAKAAPHAQYSASQYTHAFYLPEIGKDFAFEPGATFTELADGTARLVGTIRRSSNPSRAFQVEVLLSDRLNPGSPGYPPADSPKQSLYPSAYAENGGPIEPGTFHYYQVTDGLLTGIDDYAGAVLHVTRMGPAFQVGMGANDKNLHYGASGWLVVSILSQPTTGVSIPSELNSGDINIDLECQ